MSKAIELSSALIGGDSSLGTAKAAASELRRLAAVEKQLEAAQAESVRLAAQLAEEKLRADQMTEQHRMQSSICAAAQAELAAIRALEPVAWHTEDHPKIKTTVAAMNAKRGIGKEKK